MYVHLNQIKVWFVTHKGMTSWFIGNINNLNAV